MARMMLATTRLLIMLLLLLARGLLLPWPIRVMMVDAWLIGLTLTPLARP